MRTTMKAFHSCAILAGVLLAASGAMADESCTAGGYTVTTPGPVVSGGSTSITYSVTGPGNVDHAATVVASGSTNCLTSSITAVTGPGNQAYGPGVGDPVTGLGKWACHEEAAKINPNANTFNFSVTVSGTRGSAPKTVALKKGSKISACEIVGIGDPAVPVEIAPVIESYTHGWCTLVVTMEKKSGNVLGEPEVVVSPLAPSGTVCDLLVDDVEITIGGYAHGKPNFGKGYLETGDASCTTYVWGGRAYSFGSPCPD